MQWIILIGNEHFNLKLIRDLQHDGENTITSLNTNRFVVDYGNDHVFYESVEDIINDYEEDDIKRIPFPNPHFIMMTYTNGKLMKQILSQDNFPRGIYIDDDNGNILPIEEFIVS
ncbi:hypothetical protein [Paenibacillus riograndensis]|uniref:Uncharacterized protein n=2 Tax=Paenibacillus riograndensis TaxID=483937 RepID=A0A132UBK2_9BACL|nr:hypothetical protein [Paenibacillus riograndensis]KWX81049.1 hypothetical protein AMQ84_01285 [Paenibacillus riograndensis]KWX81113.1 hypothetical protein AMQ83_35075 [Paenibacillus riograndensis]CQR57007.1 hypothetical protein PRIO_4605 [Paenibacillus riograndensis SBR5]